MAVIFWLLFVLYLIASGVLILVVLVQSGKGGGLSSLVGAGTTLGDTLGASGVEKTLNRWTSYCAIGFLVINILLVIMGPSIFDKEGFLNKVPVTAPSESTPLTAPGDAVPAEGPPASAATGSEVPAAPAAAIPAAPATEFPAPAPLGEAPAPAPATAAAAAAAPAAPAAPAVVPAEPAAAPAPAPAPAGNN